MAKVNENCIGCQVCVSLAPEIFAMKDDGHSNAIKQPSTPEEQANFENAKAACPVAAIEDWLPE